eukprot:5222480-Prymnesium_polylepis.1
MSCVADRFRRGMFTFRLGSLHPVAKLDNDPRQTAELDGKLHGLPKLLVLSGLAWRRFGHGLDTRSQRRNRKVEQDVFGEGDVVQESMHHSEISEDSWDYCDLVRTVLTPNGKTHWLDEDDEDNYDRGANTILAYREGNRPLKLHNELVERLGRCEVRLPPMVWDCVEVTQEGEIPRLPNVMDAAQHNRAYFNEYLEKHLTQHVEFPATGDSDPFARIADASSWFGDVYAPAAAVEQQ